MKQTRGTYIAFSDLYDRRPAEDELLAIIKSMPLERALILAIRVNLSLRFVQQELGKPNFSRLQFLLASNFCNKDTFDLIKSRFGSHSGDEKSIALPIHCLNLLRLILLESTPTASAAQKDEEVRWNIGTSLLMMSDLLLKKEELQAIIHGTRNERALALMVQFLALFELLNPPKIHHLAIRYQLMFRTVLRADRVQRRIQSECRNLNIEGTFQEITGLSLDRWLHSVFVMHFYYQLGSNPWDHHEEYFVINRDNFVGTSDISKAELDAILGTVSGTYEELRDALRGETRTDPRFDFVAFRKKPLLRLTGGQFACIDSSFLLEQVHVGVHWVIHDRLAKDKRDDLFRAWGVLFEEYVNYLFEGMKTNLPIAYFRAPRWMSGPKDNLSQESFDGVFVRGKILCPMEFKGGFLSRKSRYSANADAFVAEMRSKFGGPHQLASKIGHVFAEVKPKRRSIENVDSDAHSVVLPILILQDHIFRVPLLNWWLNLEFQRELSKYKLRPDVKVESLNVITIHELESIVASAEAANFDFVEALHQRATLDPEMGSELLDVLLQFSNFHDQKSRRALAAIDEWSKSLSGTLFPKEVEGDVNL